MSKSNKAQKTEATVEQTVAPATVEPKKTHKVEVQPIQANYNELLTEHKTKSAMIRFLDSQKYSRGQIAKFMGIKYQFVRNVLITPVKKQTA